MRFTGHASIIMFAQMADTLTLFLITIALAPTVLSHSIWSPGVCLSDLECPAEFFCNDTNLLPFGIRSPVPRCDRRLPGNAACSERGLQECENGFVCDTEDLSESNGLRCLRRASRNEKCFTYIGSTCKDSLRCSTKNSTCQPFTTGFAGTRCRGPRGCQLNKGFYCNPVSGVCEPRSVPGDKCNILGDSFKCLGFCASQGFENGVCLPSRKEGEVCTKDEQCDNPVRETDETDPRADPLVCNIPTGSTGRCVRKSHLLTAPGAKCDPGQDLCSRSLSCLSKGRGGYVCRHRGSEYSSCDPQSSLSRCLWQDVRLECRLKRIKQTLFLPYNPSPFYACLRRSEKVARGGVCMAEYATCERGTECREVPGVLPEDFFPKYPPPRVAFCVQVVPNGSSCGGVKDKFTTQCGDGSRCENGTCMKVKNNKAQSDSSLTHAGLRASCGDLSCVPGLVCEREEPDSEKLCILPLKIVGKGMTCSDRAVERRRCKDGLVCAFRKDGTNLRRCRVPRKAGDYCEADKECGKGLLCPSVWTQNRERMERRCYDPKMTLSLGQACDPKASGSQARCIANERPDFYVPSETDLDPMRCMAKGGAFVCRVVRQLFESCNEPKDIVCDSGLYCGRFGVCIPIGET